MRFNLIISTVFLSALFCFSLGYSDCGSEFGEIVDITILNCAKDAKRCLLKRNSNTSIEITFKPKADSDAIKSVVHGVIADVPVPFPLPNEDGCKDSGIDCPVKAGNTYKYVTKLPVKSSYPRITVDVKWELKNSEDKDIVCALIPAKIVA